MTTATVSPDGDGTFSGEQLDDEAARRWFEVLLSVRRTAEDRPEQAARAAEFAAHAAGLLSRGVLGWAAEALGLLYSDDEAQRPPVEEERRIIASTRRFGLPVMQPSAKNALADALLALNADQVDPLLRPSRPGRRGGRPYDTAWAELSMLMWVRWQHGRGRRVADAEAELATTLNSTPATIQKWRTELPKVFGEKQVARALDNAERLGRVEAAKEAGLPEAEATNSGDDPEGFHWAVANTPRSLDPAKAMRRRGKGSKG